jgi:hypothetical protein
MDIFVSYAREDTSAVEVLVTRLQDLGHRAWIDRQLTGGQVWWDQVLQNIRMHDAVALALSPSYCASEACESERRYAAELRKPLLPIQVAPLAVETLPHDLARLQIVDYQTPSEEAAIRLARAVTALPPPTPLTPPFPEAPPVPYSYISHLAEQVRQPPATQDAQLELVSRLESALKSPDFAQRRAAAELLTALQEHPDIYAETYHRVERLREPVQAASMPPPSAPRNESAAVPADASGTSGVVKFLAGVGLFVIVIFVIGLCSASEEDPCFDYLGNEVQC